MKDEVASKYNEKTKLFFKTQIIVSGVFLLLFIFAHLNFKNQSERWEAVDAWLSTLIIPIISCVIQIIFMLIQKTKKGLIFGAISTITFFSLLLYEFSYVMAF